MFAFLRTLVEIQSGSCNKAGVDAVGQQIAHFLETCRVTCRTVAQDRTGNHLVVRSGHQRPKSRILLAGHMDTVFPEDTLFKHCRDNGDRVCGPGVIDMKGGLVAGIFALKALDAADLLPQIPICFIFNSDEEIGSPTSRDLIRREARDSCCALVLECGGPAGEIVTGRKGNLSFKVTVRGRAGHAAFAGPDKASAVLALARHTIALESLNCPEKGITVNVGRVGGGIGANTVAEQAEAWVDVRYKHPGDARRLESKIREILAAAVVPGTAADVEIRSERPPMPVCEAGRRLFQTVRQTARHLGMDVREEFRYGVSDANLIAAEGVPVVDGLGPVGGRDHSPEEYMLKSSLPARTLLLACTLATLGGFENHIY